VSVARLSYESLHAGDARSTAYIIQLESAGARGGLGAFGGAKADKLPKNIESF
jgi:hypothetical protein